MGEPGLQRDILPPELTGNPVILPRRILYVVELMSELNALLMELAEPRDVRMERERAYKLG
jgi:hypothetical protein